MDDERNFLRSPRETFERNHQREMAPSKSMHLVRHHSSFVTDLQLVNEGRIVIIEIQPNHNALTPHPRTQVSFKCIRHRTPKTRVHDGLSRGRLVHDSPFSSPSVSASASSSPSAESSLSSSSQSAGGARFLRTV